MATRLLALAVQSAILIAVLAIWNPPWRGLLSLALAYVLAVWIVAEGITLWMYLAFSLEPFSDLVAASLRASAIAMWLVPGVLLMASRSQLAVSVGLAAVINSACLLASSRAPGGGTFPTRRPAAKGSEPLLFRYQSKRAVYFSWETAPTILGALVLQMGIYALAGDYPLLAAASFATATGIWVAVSVGRGAMEPRTGARAPYSAPGMFLTLLLTVTLTAVLIRTELVQEAPVEDSIAAEFLKSPGLTRQVLQRLVHVPSGPAAPANVEAAAKAVVTRVVDPGPAIGTKGQNGVPGVVLRPRPKRRQRPTLIAPGAQLRFSAAESLEIPFTGEYHLFRTSSGSLPAGAIVEPGTPLESVFGTTNGGPMDTVAVQTFDPPIDLTRCGMVLVLLTSAEVMPLLASMQLVAEGRVEDGGTELMGIKQAREETLEFQIPVTAKPLLVHAIRVSFQRPGVDRDKNVRVAVERFTLVSRGRRP
jgi:hypothetical protein